jgi:hypothetical protein
MYVFAGVLGIVSHAATTVTVMRISEETFVTLNASKHAVTLSGENGGGRMALYEGFHLLHCVVSLLLVRSAYRTDGVPENVMARHISRLLPLK